jgi:hypothetical protein
MTQVEPYSVLIAAVDHHRQRWVLANVADPLERAAAVRLVTDGDVEGPERRGATSFAAQLASRVRELAQIPLM